MQTPYSIWRDNSIEEFVKKLKFNDFTNGNILMNLFIDLIDQFFSNEKICGKTAKLPERLMDDIMILILKNTKLSIDEKIAFVIYYGGLPKVEISVWTFMVHADNIRLIDTLVKIKGNHVLNDIYFLKALYYQMINKDASANCDFTLLIDVMNKYSLEVPLEICLCINYAYSTEAEKAIVNYFKKSHSESFEKNMKEAYKIKYQSYTDEDDGELSQRADEITHLNMRSITRTDESTELMSTNSINDQVCIIDSIHDEILQRIIDLRHEENIKMIKSDEIYARMLEKQWKEEDDRKYGIAYTKEEIENMNKNRNDDNHLVDNELL